MSYRRQAQIARNPWKNSIFGTGDGGIGSPSRYIRTVPLPRVFINTELSNTPAGGRTITCHSGDNLQTKIDSLIPGDTLLIDNGISLAGVTITGQRSGGVAGAWIHIKPASFSIGEHTRITPTTAASENLPKIISASASPAITVISTGTTKWRIMGLELKHADDQTTGNSIILFGFEGEGTLAQIPENVIIDRCYLHGRTGLSLHRGVSLHGRNIALINNHIDNVFGILECQAIWGWNGFGPYKIVNNYLGAATEGWGFGGAQTQFMIDNQAIAADIEFQQNYVKKNLSWKGTYYEKNVFELKAAQFVLIKNNVKENGWVDGQQGWCGVLWSVNQNGLTPFIETKNITIQSNIFKNCTAGFQISGVYGDAIPAHHIAINDNIFLGINNSTITSGSGGEPFFAIQQAGIHDIYIQHNTGYLEAGAIDIFQITGLVKQKGIVLTDNNFGGSNYKIFMNSGATWNTCTGDDSEFKGNIIADVTSSDSVPASYIASLRAMPVGNYYPLGFDQVGLTDTTDVTQPDIDPLNLVLLNSSPYKGKGSDGFDPGADIPTILDNLVGVAA